MSRYIFEQKQEDRELLRLRMIEKAVDPITIDLLQSTGITSGWQCLELGTGAGSILQWIGNIVGSEGLVLGIDKNIKYVEKFSGLPYELLEGDVLNISLNRQLDLVHCRYVLIHNKEDDSILKKLRSFIKPGGYLVLEEPDFTSAKLLNSSSDDSHFKVNNALCKMFTNAGLNPAYGIELPKKLQQEGFEVIHVNTKMHLCAGGQAISNLMAESACVLAEEYIATGEANQQDLDTYVQNAHNESYWSIYYSTVSVVAKNT